MFFFFIRLNWIYWDKMVGKMKLVCTVSCSMGFSTGGDGDGDGWRVFTTVLLWYYYDWIG
jgi:hypothetical protein